ncbi:mismatch-specific DNA-glycosylase [Corynebacterium sp. 32222D000AT]|uniref:mismatch-specific DNA-glycosylase n=1 Tax=unclassified Corynebacterium TaxID=2624378 RepID=UPI002A93FAA8|nr:mismatch-specific DNA-glycosylase [Mycobacteriaceae bacterium]MDY5828741.1 mismatch-specific DNA-glycosylase [Corynebacterium sp.]
MRFSQEQLAAYRGATVPDLLPEPLRLLFVGINPSLWTAATGAHFARPGNRFYPGLYQAGLTTHQFDASGGYADADFAELQELGIGVSNLVPRATARADELTTDELLQAPARLDDVVSTHHPKVVAVLGITAYRKAFKLPQAVIGEQDSPWEGTRLFVLDNPSGLNAHASVADHAAGYRKVAQAAGIEV